jgi:hypothetical protein
MHLDLFIIIAIINFMCKYYVCFYTYGHYSHIICSSYSIFIVICVLAYFLSLRKNVG